MRKYDFSFDQEAVDEYIKTIQAKLPDYKINVNNVNDFAQMLRDKACCKVCKGLSECGNNECGYYTDYVDGQFVSKMCKYKHEEKIKLNKESLIKTLYLSSSILNANLAEYHIDCDSRRKIYARVSEFILGFKAKESVKGLYLYGTFGTGKTYSLAAIANELGRNDIACLLIYFPDLVVDLKNALGTSRFESLINMLKSVDVLMLDDMGSENMTPWIRDEILGPIVNYRVNEGRPIFISSNLNPNELTDHFAIDRTPSSLIKGRRIMNRLQALMNTVSMDDSKPIRK